MAILFITHDLNLVRHFADDVLIMYRSRVVEYGETNTIYTNPVDPYTKALLHCRPPMHQRIKLLKSVEESINETDVRFDATNTISSESFHQRITSLEKQSPILELKNLHCWYPVKRNIVGNTSVWYKAVDGVSLSIKEGETLGLVGESGCGKTTIGKSIVLLTDITKGEILYRGKNIQDFSTAELAAYRKNVQMIFQDPYSSLNPRISIGEAIREPMDVHGIHASSHRKQKVIDLLEKVGLSADHYQRYPHEFSGGQRQRICIARALALEPQCIICDESVSALDVSVQAQVLNLLVSLRDEYNLSYLFISHDLRVVKHISDHVAVMQKGHIEEVGNAEQIYNAPSSDYTRTLIASSL
jgi:peptide/nickel transport system ATP-binding protein